MDFNIFLARFGLDSSNFINKVLEPIEFENGFIYEVEEQNKKRICPHCQHQFMRVHDRDIVTYKLNSTVGRTEILRVRRIRYKCPHCHKTHTFELVGLKRRTETSNLQRKQIESEFHSIQSFSDIAKRYGLSSRQVINMFDQYTEKGVNRLPLPEYLCIDEKHFENDADGSYIVILSDFLTGEIVDVIFDRRMPYLKEYFSNISLRERNKVKFFISDMYEGYSSIKDEFFKDATFVVDLFHIVKQLTEAVKRLRIRTYNQYTPEDCIERQFMKQNWKVFIMDKRKLKGFAYRSEKYHETLDYHEIILRCLKRNMSFWDGYNTLQELYHYDTYSNFTNANKFMDRIIAKLTSNGDELLTRVASTYEKWRVGIINGLIKHKDESGNIYKRITNAVAESNNSHIARLINVSYGYKNFIRLRKRIMLIRTYKKRKESTRLDTPRLISKI